MEQTKICSKCKIEKDINLFFKSCNHRYRGDCKECYKRKRKLSKKPLTENQRQKRNEYSKKYKKNNHEKVKEIKTKSYHKNKNKEKIIKHKKEYLKIKNENMTLEQKEIQRKYLSEYYKKNKKERNEYAKKYNIKRRKEDTIFKLYNTILSSINRGIKRGSFTKQGLHTEQILGIKIHDYKIYLESKFKSWMSWDNYGKYNGELNYGWDIDHIIPTSSAKTEGELNKLFNYKNTQPLCSYTNRDIKKDKIN